MTRDDYAPEGFKAVKDTEAGKSVRRELEVMLI